MEVRWSGLAADDLERICAWIERDNPEAARRVAKIVYEGCGQLASFPYMGASAAASTDGESSLFLRYLTLLCIG